MAGAAREYGIFFAPSIVRKMYRSSASAGLKKGIVMTSKCFFCRMLINDTKNEILAQNDLAVIIRDTQPVSNGHSLIIPRRHVSSFFDTSPEERTALMALLDQTKKDLDREFSPDDYNIGINDGPLAGQSIPHLHMHLIPRYKGDKEDPRGGVRWIIPEKAKYW